MSSEAIQYIGTLWEYKVLYISARSRFSASPLGEESANLTIMKGCKENFRSKAVELKGKEIPSETAAEVMTECYSLSVRLVRLVSTES